MSNPNPSILSQPTKHPDHLNSYLENKLHSSFLVINIVISAKVRIIKCLFFTNRDPISRYELVKRKGLCLNCLFPIHISNNYLSSNRCQHCQVSHHTLLHREKAKQNPIAAANITTNEV
ncbi:hypothetical protein CVS40_9707 [Lucilia cuprina]|nr:hypothetical protein CVS40_9707 [Lucilia cuprina]